MPPSPSITVQCSIDVKIEEPRVHSSGTLRVSSEITLDSGALTPRVKDIGSK